MIFSKLLPVYMPKIRITMRLLNLLTLITAPLWLFGCSSLSVNYDYDTQTDFSQLKTYNWLDFPGNANVSEFNRARFITAVENTLASKGFKQYSSSPDFVIATHFGKKSKVDITNWGYSYAPHKTYTGYGYRYPSNYAYVQNYGAQNNLSVYEYEEGTLILDFVDTKTRKLLWRATAKAIVSPASSPEKQTIKINNAVKKILEEFPPEKVD